MAVWLFDSLTVSCQFDGPLFVRIHSIMFEIVKGSTITGGGVGGPGCRCRCTCGAGGAGYAAHVRRGSLRGLQRIGEGERERQFICPAVLQSSFAFF